MIIESIASALTAFSFGVLFNIKGKRLIAAAVGGGISWFIYKLCLENNMIEPTAFFIAAVCFSIYCEICARIYKTPTTTLTVCCLIPLVPGYGIYNTMFYFIKGEYIIAIEHGINTLSLAGALALGVIFVSTIFRNLKLHKLLNNIINSINNKDTMLEKTFD